MYEGKLSDIEAPEMIPTWIDDYRRGELWFELVDRLRCSCGGQEHARGHEHGLALIMYADSGDSSVVLTEGNLCVDEGWRDDSVFVPIRQISKVAEHSVLRPIPTVIRLKLFDLRMSRRGEEANVIPVESTYEGVFGRQAPTSEPEHDARLFVRGQSPLPIGGMLDGKRPSDMVKGCSQIRQNVSDHQGPVFVQFGFNGYRYDIAKALKFACFANGDLWVKQAVNTPFESLDVCIRPLDLELGAIEWMLLLHITPSILVVPTSRSYLSYSRHAGHGLGSFAPAPRD